VNRDRDEAAQEFMDEIVDDLGYTPRGAKGPEAGSAVRSRSPRRFVVPGAIAAVIGMVLLVSFLAGGSGTQELVVVQAGLDRIEAQLVRLDDLEKRIARLEEQEKKRPKAVSHAGPQRSENNRQKRATAPDKEKYHTVRPGESLYIIARKYGLTTDQLCKLNDLSPKKPIQPGQKLRVGGVGGVGG